MEQNAFTGQMIATLTALIGLGSVLVTLGRLMQKLDQLHKDNKELKGDIDEVRSELAKEKENRELWRDQLSEKLTELSERTIVMETRIAK